MTEDRLRPSAQESALPADSETLDAEIEKGLDNELGAFGFLNNFASMLPGGFYDKYIANHGLTDELVSPGEERRQEEPQSQRYKQATYGDFLRDRDTALAVTTLDLQELERLKDKYKKAAGPEHLTALNAYLSYALPVYRQLRLMGYSHRDLVT